MESQEAEILHKNKMIKNTQNFLDGPNAIHVYDQSQEKTDDQAFSSEAYTQEDYMNAKISQGAIFHKIDASGTSRESAYGEIKTGGFSLNKNHILNDSLLAHGSRATSPPTGGKLILVQANGMTVESSTNGHQASVNSSGARNGKQRARSNLKGPV
jgi:hypothetical protein